jgi:DNA anti-recombination protein RmuC
MSFRYNERMENETEIEKLARMVESGFAEMRGEFAEVHSKIDNVEKRLNEKINRVQANLDHHRQETKDGFSGLHRVIGGISSTLTDHEERLKVLEGE